MTMFFFTEKEKRVRRVSVWDPLELFS